MSRRQIKKSCWNDTSTNGRWKSYRREYAEGVHGVVYSGKKRGQFDIYFTIEFDGFHLKCYGSATGIDEGKKKINRMAYALLNEIGLEMPELERNR